MYYIRDNVNSGSSEIDMFFHNATLMGYNRNEKWLSKVLLTDFVGPAYSEDPVPQEDKEAFKNSFMKLFEIFSRKYEDQMDVVFSQTEDYHIHAPSFRVIYPEVTVRNSRGQTTDIKDLVVLHQFVWDDESKNLNPIRIEGTRLSLGVMEILSGYYHSHLPSRGRSYFEDVGLVKNPFCVGNTDLSMMEGEFEVEMDYDRYELYLYLIDSYVTWESLEGTPYISLTKITDANKSTINNFKEKIADTLVSKILDDKVPIEVDFYLAADRFQIKRNKKASDFIRTQVVKYLSEPQQSEILCIYHHALKEFFGRGKGEEVTPIKMPVTYNREGEEESPYMIFRGEKRTPKIIRTDKRVNKILPVEDHIIYPKFLDYVLRKLEARYYNTQTTNSAIRIYSARRDATRSSTSDKVSM